MEQEARKELHRGLCSLLPFGVMCWTPNGNGHLCSIDQTAFSIEYGVNISATKREYFEDDESVKPYLRPMSSMTDDEWREYKQAMYKSSFSFTEEDWFNSHYFDHRGLIDKGLALEAPEGMYKTE